MGPRGSWTRELEGEDLVLHGLQPVGFRPRRVGFQPMSARIGLILADDDRVSDC